MTDYAKGIYIRERNFDNGGSVINMSFDITQFFENPINDEKYINLTIKRGKESGKLYAVNDEYYQKEKEND